LTAGIDLSVGSVLAVSAVLGMQVSLMGHQAGWAIPMFLVSGLAMGILNGAMVAFLGINAFVVTLGTMTAFRGAAYLLADGTTVLNNTIPSFEWIGNGEFLHVPWLIWIAIGVVMVSWVILRKTVLGLHIYSVGGSPQAARLTGFAVRVFNQRSLRRTGRCNVRKPAIRSKWELGKRLRTRCDRCCRAWRHEPYGRCRHNLGHGGRRIDYRRDE
jgi:predicted ABC-type sugar transport system permease subunit